MIVQSCIIALIGMGAIFAFLFILIAVTLLMSKTVGILTRSNLSEIAAAVAFARHQKGE